MKISLNVQQCMALKRFLQSFEDAEQLSEREYVLDLYELEQPLSIDLILNDDGLTIDGAAELLFDEELDGWYVGTRIEDADTILTTLQTVGALGK